jgi:phosphatidylinositol alpha-1,6-mannosyltransferase
MTYLDRYGTFADGSSSVTTLPSPPLEPPFHLPTSGPQDTAMTPAEDRRLRIALLTDVFLPQAGGSRFYYYNLFRRISEHDDVAVLTSRVPGWQAFDGREQTPSFRILRRFSPLRDLSYSQLPKLAGTMLRTLSLALTRRPDVLHCGDLYPPGLTGVLFKKLFGIPFVAYCHGEDVTLTDERKYQPKVRNLIYKSADAVIANGEFAIAKLLDLGLPKDKVFKITPGLDTSVFFPEPSDTLRKRYGLGNELVLLTVARVIPRKGHARIIRAIAALGSDVPPLKYIIGGKGAYEQVLRTLASELGVEDKIIFAGFVSEAELNLHYNLADIMVMPNTEEKGDIEGFGMVFLEANAAGKPVIGGRSGGTADAVEHGVSGYLVNSEDDRDLIEKLRSLLTDDQLRSTMGAAGLRRVQTEFSWEPRAAKLRQITANIAAAHGRGRQNLKYANTNK